MTFHTRQDDTAEWLSYLQPEGLVVGANVLRERGLNPIRQSPLDTAATAEALALDPEAPREDDRHFILSDPWRFFEAVLRWPTNLAAGSPGGPSLPSGLTITVPEHETVLEPDMAVLWNKEAPEGSPAQALVMLHPTFDPDARNQFAAGEWEASPHQRLERLLRETNVGVGILIARNTLRLVYAPRGETAGWMSWPLAALGRVEGRPMLAGLKLCLGRNAFFTGAPETRLRALLQASRDAQNEVSEKLSGQVLGALHELLRGLHRADPARIETLAEADPQHIYEGLLTCLMRLVFLLYAEDRDLLPSSNDPQLKQLWEGGYSLKSLYARLLTDEALNPDTMDERRGAWGQLLAVFRLVHDGAPGWVARRGGKLFDPERFPFLEGRDKGSARADAAILPVSDGAILRILHGLMTVEGRSLSGEKIRERLSYRSLDVESIGSVYETVMGFTACRATERMLALRDEKKLPTFIGLDTLLGQKPADRQKWLKEHSIKLSAKQAKAVKDAADVATLVEVFGGLVDERASPKSTPIGAGVPYLQPTEERRRSGSHYTPRSLTEPIVRHALEPAFSRIGEKASPETVLSLKVLDPACGSGAFLVEACRQLGARLEQAWNMYGAEKPVIPPDEDEALHARRLVAQKCLYGVDRNPMAVDLARLSLWLATLAREHEFTFLDHALKAGDSLVGLTRAEIAAAHWDPSKPGLPLFRTMIKEAVDRAREGREAIRNAADDVLLEAQAARYSRVQDASAYPRIVGDAVIAAFFSADKPRAREQARQEVESWITGSSPPRWDALSAKASGFHKEQGWRPFHWEIEFPEVFARDNPGFDAIVGNPPFLGGSLLSAAEGSSYMNWLLTRFSGSHGKSDLVAYFFRRSFEMLRLNGNYGLIATKTIRQGSTRSTSLEYIVNSGGQICRAWKRFRWPGEANVIVSIVHVVKGKASDFTLDGIYVSTITSFLLPFGPNSRPPSIKQNNNIAYSGINPNGAGFVLSKDEYMALISGHDYATKYIQAYLSSDDLNSDPRAMPTRYIINTGHLSELELEDVPGIYDHLRSTVYIERSKNPDKKLRQYWWRFSRPAVRLYSEIKKYSRVLVMGRLATHHTFAFQDVNTIFSDALSVFLLPSFSDFCVVQSRAHELWAKFLGSSFKDDPRYIPEDCFETFPFPAFDVQNTLREQCGKEYYKHRAISMTSLNEGMTQIYNRFHDPSERSGAIRRLRELHDEMDRAVLRAYGWDDLADDLRPEFLTEATDDDHAYQGRYFWPAEARDRVLARLLALNAERHAEEVAAGVAPLMKTSTTKDDDENSPDLLDLE